MGSSNPQHSGHMTNPPHEGDTRTDPSADDTHRCESRLDYRCTLHEKHSLITFTSSFTFICVTCVDFYLLSSFIHYLICTNLAFV